MAATQQTVAEVEEVDVGPGQHHVLLLRLPLPHAADAEAELGRPGEVHHGDIQVEPLRPFGLPRADLLALFLLTERLSAVVDADPHVDQIDFLHINSAGGLDVEPEGVVDSPQGVRGLVCQVGGSVGTPQPAGQSEVRVGQGVVDSLLGHQHEVGGLGLGDTLTDVFILGDLTRL